MSGARNWILFSTYVCWKGYKLSPVRFRSLFCMSRSQIRNNKMCLRDYIYAGSWSWITFSLISFPGIYRALQEKKNRNLEWGYPPIKHMWLLKLNSTITAISKRDRFKRNKTANKKCKLNKNGVEILNSSSSVLKITYGVRLFRR